MPITLPFRWIADRPASTATVVRVYRWLLHDHGLVPVQDTPDGHNLPGGSPELADSGRRDVRARTHAVNPARYDRPEVCMAS